MKLKKILHNLSKIEKILLVFLSLIVLISGYRLGEAFYKENSEINYIPGGIYTEGAVGQVDIINPLFVQQGSISDDLSRLIFSGLTKYDSKSGEIVGDLANFKVSSNGKKYTFVLKKNIKWHDEQKLTSDDILFTYKDVIKNPEFKGNILNYNDYSGIKINKIDDRTIEFLLEKPDSFFLVKTMAGILPKHLLEKESINLLKTAPFNFSPIGSGKYKFVSQIQMADHMEYSLEAFENFYDGKAHIDNILLKVFSNYEDLQKHLGDFDGIRNVKYEDTEHILKKGKFALDHYQLPQYVAIFINNESDKLKNNKIRLALQLGTDKQSLIKVIHQDKVIDTPLLEIDQKNWVNQYSIKKANGALFETKWQIPNKDEITKDKEPEDAKEDDPTEAVTFINSPNGGKNWISSKEPITITGTVPEGTEKIIINDYELKKYHAGDLAWSYIASKKFDSLKEGENIYKIYVIDSKNKKKLIDSIKITFDSEHSLDKQNLKKIKEENKQAQLIPIRENKKGEKLKLHLITSNKPSTYKEVAFEIKNQWEKIGVELDVEVLDSNAFQEKLNNREYDLLIFGQSLGYNLDAFPYWHSSQAKKGGLNLSQFKDFVVDSLLEEARLENGKARKDTLENIQKIINKEVPAIFLYSPTYYTALKNKIYHPPFTYLSTTSDRLGNIEDWYAKIDRKFKKGTNPLTLFSWLIKQF